jgi:hypothetical protein
VEHENGTGDTTAEVSFVASRFDGGQRVACVVNSSALDTPIQQGVVIEVNTAPDRLALLAPSAAATDSGAVASLVAEGARVTVQCVAAGARPPAYIYWNSEPELDLNDSREEIVRTATTFTTVNQVSVGFAQGGKRRFLKGGPIIVLQSDLK